MERKANLGMAVIVTSALLTVGCGGGSSSTEPTSNNVTGVELSGVVSKGIFAGAQVEVVELDTNGDVLRVVGTTTTDNTGAYSITLNDGYEGGVIKVKMTTDANTLMKCDALSTSSCGTFAAGNSNDSNSNGVIDRGEWYTPTSTVTLNALLEPASANAVIDASVTPFTEMAAVRAASSGSYDAATIAAANSEVSNLLGGIDILRTRPVDVTDAATLTDASGTAQTYSLMNAALMNMSGVDGTTGEADVQTAIDNLASNFSQGTIAASDDGTDPTVISLQDIVAAMDEQATDVVTIDPTASLDATVALVTADLEQDITDANATGGTIDPIASDTTTLTEVAKVKAFVGDMRTWGEAIGLESNTQATAFDNSISLATEMLNMDMEYGYVPGINAVIEAMALAISDNTLGTDLSTYPITVTDPGGIPMAFDSGMITVSGSTITITDAKLFNNFVTVNMTGTVPAVGSSTSTVTIGITSGTVVDQMDTITVNNGTFTLNLDSPWTVDLNGSPMGISSVDVDMNLELRRTMGLDMSSMSYVDLADPITFSGALSFNVLTTQDQVSGEIVDMTAKSATLSGTISSDSGNSFDGTLTLDIANAANWTMFAVPEGSVASIGTFTADDDGVLPDSFAVALRDGSSGTMTAEIDGSLTFMATDPYGGYSYTIEGAGTYTSITNAVMMYGYGLMPQWDIYVAGEGEYMPYFFDPMDYTNGGLLATGSVDGEMVSPELQDTASNYADASVGMSFTAALAGLPQATFSVSFDRTAYQAGTANLSLAYGTRRIEASNVTIDGVAQTVTGSVVVTNQDGVQMIFAPNTTMDGVEVKLNGNTYATISEDPNTGLMLIRYTDGTFESL